ncbi:hypothetical protein ACLOJK_024958 [Asimina triloba]
MADAIASLLLQTVYENLKSKAVDGVRHAWDIDEEVENLSSTLSAIQAVLEDAEEKQIESKPVKDWLQKLKAVAYDADDVVDEFAIEAQRLELQGVRQGKSRKVMTAFISFVNSTFSSLGWKGETFQQYIARRIDEIRVRLDQIADEQKKFHLQTREGSKRVEIRPQRDTSSFVDEKVVFGRDGEKEEIVGIMLSGCASRREIIPVVAIVGMGGLGKTTVAQLVFNDPRVGQYFDLCAWVCVSDDFDVKRLTREIIESATKTPCALSNLDSMHHFLQNVIAGKRCLIVLDDVWNKNRNYWEQLQTPFIAGARGSKILVTTRDKRVSSVMGAMVTHDLKGLSDHGCWSLFKRRASIDESIASHPGMLLIKEKVVERCQGLPLAVKALGGLLYTKDPREWNGILDSKIWNLPGETSDVLPVLRLSYHHLPTNLKQCFAFCSMYPKDYRLEKGELVQLWISEGFVQEREGKPIEDTGSEHFDELLRRSFLQHSTSDGFYVMHDLIHDLALFISSSECSALESGKTCTVPKAARHLSFICASGTKSEDIEALHQKLHPLRQLRTFLLIHGSKTPEMDPNCRMDVPHDFFQKFSYLRVLDLSYAKITELPKSMDSSKHLRYLNLSNTSIRKFPGSLSSIYSLQTLKVTYCRSLVEFPNNFNNLMNLRHIHNKETGMTLMPHGFGKLTSLQTLAEFIVGKERGHGIEELQGLTSLQGMINILNLENVVDAEAAKGACLRNKPYISELKLDWSFTRGDTLQARTVEEGVLDGLQPHHNLKVLKINWYNGTCFPSWMTSNSLLPHLVHLELYRCSRCSLLPPLGQLPSLKYLTIEGMDEVKHIGHELCGIENAFPMLEELQLKSLPNLEEWCGINEGDFPHLRKFQMYLCRKLKQLPNLRLPALAHLEIDSCEELISLPHLPRSLQKLEVNLLANLEEWCRGFEAEFSFLEELIITNCPKMQTWPSSLSPLKYLQICSCQGFVALPPLAPSLSKLLLYECNERVLRSLLPLTSITYLEIGRVPELTVLPPKLLQPLTKLKELKILGCQELLSLLREDALEDERLPMGLTSLEIADCPKLNSLPRGLHFHSSLETLKISNCPQLSSLPDEGLPKTLQYLEIQTCPTLKERCQKEVGQDWPKIALIHHIMIDYKRIFQDWSGFYSRVTVAEAKLGNSLNACFNLKQMVMNNNFI